MAFLPTPSSSVGPPWAVLPRHLQAWALETFGSKMLTLMLENSATVKACIRGKPHECKQHATFHVSALDSVTKVRSELHHQSWRGYNTSLPDEGGVLVDIGGNLGIVAVTTVLRNPGCVRVLSVEPNPETLVFLRWNLWENHISELNSMKRIGCGVLPVNAALTNDGRNISLQVGARAMNAHIEGAVSPYDDKFDAIGGENDPVRARRGKVEAKSAFRKYTVSSFTLESLVSRYDLQHAAADILKLDCEGCVHTQPSPLRGLSQRLARAW